MQAIDFLRTIWPSQGFYVIATPVKSKSTGKSTYAHKVFESVDEAVAYVDTISATKDVYYAVHTMRERQFWNADFVNKETGEKGKWQVRVQANMLASRAFFFDLDVKPDQPEKNYTSQKDALISLKDFCDKTGLPRPMVVSSGGGLHVYWLLNEDMPSDEWRVEANKLKTIAVSLGLRVDPARTTDTASVLRVAGTYNLKNPESPRLVRVLTETKTHSPDEFAALLDSIIEEHDIKINVMPTRQSAAAAAAFAALGIESNLTYNDAPPVTMGALIKACGQVRRLAVLRGNVSEPEWYQSLNLVRFTEDGIKNAHKISSGHPSYDYDETEAKLHQLESGGYGPTTCQKLADECGSELCNKCPHFGKVKSPLVAARGYDTKEAPVHVTSAGEEEVQHKIPDAPFPFRRLKGKGIVRVKIDEENGEELEPIYENDLYPVARVVNVGEKLEQQIWCAVLPRVGATEFLLDSPALYDVRQLASTLSNAGVYPQPGLLKRLQDYMVAYIKELQKQADAEAQSDHLGWTSKMDQFILPDGVLQLDGTAKPVTMTKSAASAVEHVTRAGTLEKQLKLLNFYAHPAYLVNQFFVLAGLAAPLFHAAGQHGVVINASGNAGASKSTSLYTAASLWGHPELYPLNGTNEGATALARQQRMTTLANLPLCVDEITHMPAQNAATMVMSVTQPGNRITLLRDRTERKASTDSYKSTIMLTTANSSLHGLLSTDNAAGTAGSMRVFEIEFKATKVHQKYEADEYLRELKQNFGHVGPAFMQYVMKNKDNIEARIHAKMRYVDEKAQIQSSERFWAAAAACILVSGEIAKDIGLLNYDVDLIDRWLFEVQFPAMRGVVNDEYSNPQAILADFIERYNSRILVTDTDTLAGKKVQYVVREPRGDMIGHMLKSEGVLVLNKTAFKDHCTRIGASSVKILNDLSKGGPDAIGRDTRVVMNQRVKKTLGTGTDFAKVQSWCFIVNLKHPEVAEAVNLDVVDGGSITNTGTASAEASAG